MNEAEDETGIVCAQKSFMATLCTSALTVVVVVVARLNFFRLTGCQPLESKFPLADEKHKSGYWSQNSAHGMHDNLPLLQFLSIPLNHRQTMSELVLVDMVARRRSSARSTFLIVHMSSTRFFSLPPWHEVASVNHSHHHRHQHQEASEIGKIFACCLAQFGARLQYSWRCSTKPI